MMTLHHRGQTTLHSGHLSTDASASSGLSKSDSVLVQDVLGTEEQRSGQDTLNDLGTNS